MSNTKTTSKAPITRRNSGESDKYSGESESPGLMIFEFLEDNEKSPDSSCNSGNSFDIDDFVENDDEEDENCYDGEGNTNRAFWESQEQLLQATLRRSTSLESKIRQATKDALRELNSEGVGCVCRRPVSDNCRNCMQNEISNRLRTAGHNCIICKSKWKGSPDIPSGEHTYLEVMDNTSSKRGETIRVVIELNFRAEFKMARASEEYNHLIHQLPEVFVGKAERLRALIKILCYAAKKCMEAKKMHMAPWRKHKYMQSKWFGKHEQINSTNSTLAPIMPVKHLDRPPKQRASMLTFDLLENMPSFHCSAAIRVV
ncbi:uncharacterized protein LOC114291201 [Camellia sinensis]|uniref:Uncharacterized protein n=1 Tax=Camellia sinensis var. sinensis TaxID=542762 RepID=A0A4S4DMV4_CAMSN|nr:uncharacterized protein LOC114291201 [Camellia sinensis]THG04235.1 hypothetical protein TEA_026565 [Camellia sinensis var. sinensis]